MLYERDRHEALDSDTSWDEATAREAIARIVRRTDDAFDPTPGALWPAHPDDADFGIPGPLTGLYLGAAGVLLGLDLLCRRGVAETSLALAEAFAVVYETHQALDPEQTHETMPGYLIGRGGVELVRWRVAGDRGGLDGLESCFDELSDSGMHELLYGLEGVTLAAGHVARAIGSRAWRERYLDGIETSWAAWRRRDDVDGAWLWKSVLPNAPPYFVGAAHGLVGNIAVHLLGNEIFSLERSQALEARAVGTIVQLARREGGHANWPGVPGEEPRLVQWCHGAPGVLLSLRGIPVGRHDELDRVFVEGGELIWAAGPLKKGVGVCHGTAGSAAALLALHDRTGDAIWLERARALAMHAIEQSESMYEAHGQLRHSLFNGDIGLAWVLADCVDGTFSGLPAIDVI